MQSAYGHPNKIWSLYKTERKNRSKEVTHVSGNSESYDDSGLETFTEVIDLTRYLQMFVLNSSLVLNLEKLSNSKGMFNPCMSEKTKPILFIR